MNSIINAIDTNSITTANVTSWIAPTDSRQGIVRNADFNRALESVEDSFCDVMKFSDALAK